MTGKILGVKSTDEGLTVHTDIQIIRLPVRVCATIGKAENDRTRYAKSGRKVTVDLDRKTKRKGS